MEKVRIVANRDLFNDWVNAGTMVSHLASLVQNDVEMPIADFILFKSRIKQIQTKIDLLTNRTLTHIGKCNE